MRWYTLDRTDLRFVETAPLHLCQEAEIEAPPAAVFDVLTGDRWLDWFPDMREIRWDSSRGVGGTRYVRLGHSEAHETFLAWEPAKRFAFSVDRSTNPFARAMVVDVQLAPSGNGRRTRVHFCWHLALRSWFVLLQPIVRRRVGQMLREVLTGLRRFVEGAARP